MSNSTDFEESDIREIQKTALENTQSTYDVDFSNINPNTLQTEGVKALNEHSYQCYNCKKKGGVEGEDQLLLTLRKGFEAFDSKEDAITSENLVPYCKECYSKAEEDLTSVASAQSNSHSLSKQAEHSLTAFEELVANNTPSLFIRKQMRNILFLFLFVSFAGIVYGGYQTGQPFEYYVNSIITIISVSASIISNYTFLIFIGLAVIIGLYTLLEHYTPKEQFMPSYKTGFNIFGLQIPYIFHPILLAVSNIVWIIGAVLVEIVNIAIIPETTVLSIVMISFSMNALLLVTLPGVFTKLVYSDKSNLLARSLVSRAGLVALYNEDVVLTSDGDSKPKINYHHVDEYFVTGIPDEYKETTSVSKPETSEDAGLITQIREKWRGVKHTIVDIFRPDYTELVGENYTTVGWIGVMNMSVIFALIGLTLASQLSSILVVLSVLTPLFTVICYLLYRFLHYRVVAEEMEQLTDRSMSETLFDFESE